MCLFFEFYHKDGSYSSLVGGQYFSPADSDNEVGDAPVRNCELFLSEQFMSYGEDIGDQHFVEYCKSIISIIEVELNEFFHIFNCLELVLSLKNLFEFFG